jgi:hypothetical protein
LKTRDLRSIAIMVGLGVALLAAGCGEKVPCNTDPAQIEALRAELNASEQLADSSSTELDAAQERQAQLAADEAALADTAELEARLAELKKGSGR